MIEGHAGALAESLTMYLLLAGACAGWGRIVLRRWRIAGAARAADPLLPWAGWAAILLLLQAVHIAVPLTAPWVLAVLLPIFELNQLVAR